MNKAAVIIPVYLNDTLKLFKKSVESILSQTFKNYKLFIAVDGKVNDDIADYLNELNSSGIEVLWFERNRGIAAVLNSTIQYCRQKDFKYIVRMDADDISLNTRLEKQIEYLDNNPDIDVLGSQAFIIDQNDRIYGGKNASPVLTYKILKKKSDIIHASVVFRTSFFDSVGYYNENVPLSEDYDLWFRAIKNGINIVSLPERLYCFRFDINNIKRRKKAQNAIIKVKLKYLTWYDYIYLIPHILVKISPSFLLKFVINRSIQYNE